MKIIAGILSLTLTIAQLAPFAIVAYSVGHKYNLKAEQNKGLLDVYDPNAIGGDIGTEVPGMETEPTVPVPIERVLKPIDTNGELEGYCTFGYNSSTLRYKDNESNTVKKFFEYEDKRSRIEFSYVTDVEGKTDIPGYIARELAGLDIPTNGKYTFNDSHGQEWWCVPETSEFHDEFDEYTSKVYYKISGDKSHAVWFRINIASGSEDEYLNEVLTQFIDSIDIYYRGKTIFETPTSGYYAEINPGDNENKAENDEEYKENDEDNNVYKHEVEKVEDSGISDKWNDLEVMIGQQKIKVPLKVKDLMQLGFSADNIDINADLVVYAGTQYTLTFTDHQFAIIDIIVENETTSDSLPLGECNISSIKIDLSKFLYIADMPDDYLILPGGFMRTVYLSELLAYFGNPNNGSGEIIGSEENGMALKKFEWVDGDKYMILYTGSVTNVYYIELGVR